VTDTPPAVDTALDAAGKALFLYVMGNATLDRWEDLKPDIREHYIIHARTAIEAYTTAYLAGHPRGLAQSVEQDMRMLLVWEQWARHDGNEGAAQLFRRCARALGRTNA
jgi:hypothetical protein